MTELRYFNEKPERKRKKVREKLRINFKEENLRFAQNLNSLMTKTFILKNRENKELGEISYSEQGFKVDIPPVKEKKEIEDLLNKFLKEGIRNLGEVILKDPIIPDDPLFLNEVRNQLARRGYIMLEKKK